MKYIKTYEDKSSDLNIGDYITYDYDINDGNKIIMRKNFPYEIKKIHLSNVDKFMIMCDDGSEVYCVIDDDFRKVSKEEAETIIIANKYNL